MENTNYSIRSLTDEIGKDPKNFTKADIINFICENEIRHINFQYPAGDGRLKTLNFVINDLEYLEEILSCGERVDGSPLSKPTTATFMLFPVSALPTWTPSANCPR